MTHSNSPLPNSFKLTTPSSKPQSSSISDSLKQLLDHSRQLQAGITNSANPLHSTFNPTNQYQSSGLGLSTSLPTVQLGLDQIESQSRRLISKLRKNENLDSISNHQFNSNHKDSNQIGLINAQGSSSKANYLLAGAGVNADELGRTIDAVDLRGTFEPLQPLQDTDVEGYLKHEHEQSIIASIEEGRRQTVQDFYQLLNKSLRQNWEQQKELLFEELGRHQPSSNQTDMFFGSNSIHHHNSLEMGNSYTDRRRPGSRTFSVEGTTFGGSQLPNTRSGTNLASLDMHGKMMRYDQVVIKLNERRRQNTQFPIIHAFQQASVPNNDESSKNNQHTPLIDTWSLLKQLVQESNSDSIDQATELIGGIRLTTVSQERKFAKHYLGDPQSSEAKNLRKQLAEGARVHLQQQFLAHINMQIAMHPVEANLGGDPSISNKIRAYVELKFCKNGVWQDKRLELINQTPVWARIFYLLRIGQVSESVQFAKTQETQIRKTEPNFLSYFTSWSNSSDKRLSKTLRDRFLAEYNQRIREVSSDGGFGVGTSNTMNSTSQVDPFKLAVYKIIGRVELQRRNVPVAISSMEDWIWLQLVLVREVDQVMDHHQNLTSSTHSSISLSHDRYGLEDFGQVIAKYGESHFDPNGNRPLMYFRVLLMSGQFEKAILFLQQRPNYQLDAVHFAIALAYYGLLRISDTVPALEGHPISPVATSNKTFNLSGPSLNFARLIYRYTRLFSKAAPEIALQYLYLICLNSDVPPPSLGQQQVNLCHTYIGDLAVETASHEELLGDVRNDGTRVPGMIERDLTLIKLNDQRDYLETIVKQAAERAFRERRLRDSIRLFNIAEEYDKVIGVLNIELGNSLSQPIGSNTDANMEDGTSKGATISLTASEDILVVAKNIMEHYDRTNSISCKISKKNRETCGLLLKLKTILNLHEKGRNEQALGILDSIELLPTGNDLVQIIRKSEQIKDLDESIMKNLDLIVLCGMNILFKVFNDLKDSPYGDSGRQAKMAEIKTKARAITTFAGMLRYRLSPDTYSQLSRLQAYLH
ncbi:Nup93/Nic96-domain-containing protein [Melampsora americana]|nr:Nup93/Nic96-domain-containing protein [Melampsora americana]